MRHWQLGCRNQPEREVEGAEMESCSRLFPLFLQMLVFNLISLLLIFSPSPSSPISTSSSSLHIPCYFEQGKLSLGGNKELEGNKEKLKFVGIL